MTGMQHTSSHSGFTLLELLIVVFVVAVVAGGVIAAYGPDFIDDQEITANLFEIQQVREAVLAFRQDNPGHSLTDTNLCSAADASFLTEDSFDTDGDADCDLENPFPSYNPEQRLGWQGPYITRVGNTIASIDSDIGFNGLEITPASQGILQNGVRVLTDVYSNPFLFFDLEDANIARIVSIGPDGDYNGPDCDLTETSQSDPNFCTVDILCSSPSLNDDVVLCLR